MAKGLTLDQIAHSLGVKSSTIRLWISQGLPVKRSGPGLPNTFDLDKCRVWVDARGKKPKNTDPKPDEEEGGDDDDAGKKLKHFQARRAELECRALELRERIIKGKHLRRQDVQDEINLAIARFSDALRDFDTQIDAPDNVREQIRKCLDVIMNRLADDLHKVPKKIARRQAEKFVRQTDKDGKAVQK